MTVNIFADTCQPYYDAGLPVIPLRKRHKAPAINAWSVFCEQMPTEKQQEQWKKTYANGNIGLPLGPTSNICVVDIDSEDPEIIRLLTELLPNTPWVRYGRKGCVLAFRFNGTKSFQVNDRAGRTIVEFLSTGRQVVLPPSIHPDTQEPYTAANNLWEVHKALPVLDVEIEAIFRGALKEHGVELHTKGHSKMTDWVPQGARDITMTSMAGYFALAVFRGDCTLLESLDMMRAWKNNFVENVPGDDVDIEKGVRKVLQFVIDDVVEDGKILPTGWDQGLDDEEKEKMGLVFDEDAAAWSVGEIRDWLREQFEITDHKNVDQRIPIVEQALRRVARNPQMSEIEAEQVMTYIRDASRLKMSIPSMRRRIREIQRGNDIEGINHSEIAEQLKKRLEKVSEIRFDEGNFYRWGGAHWEQLDDTEIHRSIVEHFGHMPAARKSSDHKGIREVLTNMASKRLQLLPVNGVNFANGVVMEDGELVDHQADYGFRYTMPFRYLPEEAPKCDRFMNFLKESWGEDPDFEDKVATLQEAICATIFGVAYRYHRAPLLHGPARCGKSVLLDIVGGLVPEEGRCSVPPNKWGNEYVPGSMAGKIVNICGELSESSFIDGQAFKQIVEGAEMTVNKKYGQPFSFRPQCAHWFGSNHMPRSKDSTEGFNRRWLILTFTKPVPSKDIVRDLAEQILIEEREAIAAWAIEAMPRLKGNRDYTLPESHREMIGEVARLNNSVRFFIDCSGKVAFTNGSSPSSLISERDLYSAYSFFCSQATGVRPAPRFRFREMMRELVSLYPMNRHIQETENGASEVVYSGLTFVERKVA